MTELSDDLINAYRSTDYWVRDRMADFVLKVDQPSSELVALFKCTGATSAAFMTAWNPFSRPLSDAENGTAHEALLVQVSALGADYFEGFGADPTGQWPPERSLLVLGVGLDCARTLAANFDQNAFIWCDEEAMPRLILMR